MDSEAMVEAGARALARTFSSVRFETWSELAREGFRQQARAVLEAAGVLR